jgi:CarD family transcriptional regulator
MAQSKKSPAKSAASKPAVPRKPDKAAQAKKAVAKPVASKTAAPKAAKVKPAPAKAAGIEKSAVKAAAKASSKTQAKAAVTAAPKTKAKPEVNTAPKNNKKAVSDKRPQAKTAAAPKAAPAKAQTKPMPVKPVASAKAPMAPKAKAEALLAARAKAAPAAPVARAMPAAVHKPATRMMTAPSMPVLPAHPPTPRGAAANPKDVAAKAAEAKRQQMLAAPKKPVNSRHGFKIGESIVYPAHGVGQIVGIEEQEIAGMSLELFVIQIEKDKLTLRVPTAKLEQAGVRKLAEDNIVTRAMETLKGRARIKRTMWSRRAQEYEAKINSGDLIAIAEVVRDLYRSDTQPEQSYSERQLYESALDRMAREIAVVDKLDERTAMQRITEVLSRSARGRRTTEESAGDTQAA